MKDTEANTTKMYRRLNEMHGISYKSDEYYLDTHTYIFLSTLWEICDTIKEWDKLVENYKQKRM